MYWNNLLCPIRSRQQSSVSKTKNDNRSPFKKDFDTICNSNDLRRLQDKAQIFPLEEGDYARTRLTHSIEVLSIVESLGIGLQRVASETKNKKYLGEEEKGRSDARKWIKDIPIILKSGALLHDMGNPPFGHLTEQIISDWFAENLSHFEYVAVKNGYTRIEHSYNNLESELAGEPLQDLLHFDGNAQLLRLVTKLSLVVDDHGMNLTYPVIASFIKYPCDSCNIDPSILSRKKAGFFLPEKENFINIATKLGLDDGELFHRHPLSFLIEAADDIAYLTADIEDAHHKGIITVDDIAQYIGTNEENNRIVKRILGEIKKYRNEAINRDIPKKDDYVMHRLRILIKGEMINAVEGVLEDSYDEIMRGVCNEELLMISEVAPIVKAIRKLERDKVYYCREIIESKTKATVIIKKLLDLYVPGVLNYKAEDDYQKDTFNNLIYESLSPNYRYVCEQELRKAQDRSQAAYLKLRLVVDQISGMTDSRALSVYNLLTATK